MLDTFQAVAVAVIVVLPGATFTWAFEQRVARISANLGDRIWRFVGVSAVFLVVALPLFYAVYRHLILTGQLQHGRPIALAWWLVPPAYVALPWLVGTFVGDQAHRRAGWVRFLTGPAPSPRAWDHFFTTPGLTGWMLLKLKDGGWIAGFWGEEETPGSVKLRSYASGYPDIQEIYFADTARVDDEGSVHVDDDGRPVSAGWVCLSGGRKWPTPTMAKVRGE